MENCNFDIYDTEWINVLDELDRYLDSGLSQVELANKLEVSPAYLNDVLRKNRFPGPKILDMLGMEKVVLYRYKDGRSWNE